MTTTILQKALYGVLLQKKQDNGYAVIPLLTHAMNKYIIAYKVGDQCWIAENLNIGEMIDGTEEMTDNGVIEKYCYDNNPIVCDELGGLYQWDEIMQYTTTQGEQGICPAGWHIPTDDEWKILEGTVDSQYPVGDLIWNNFGWRGFDVGLNLKSTSGWSNNGNGTDIFGFTALPCGRCNDGVFFDVYEYAYFWSSTEIYDYTAWIRNLYFDYDDISRDNINKVNGFSVRCLKDLGEHRCSLRMQRHISLENSMSELRKNFERDASLLERELIKTEKNKGMAFLRIINRRTTSILYRVSYG